MSSLILSRQGYEERENRFLAPCAMKSSLTKGRKYPEQEHPLRSAYQRDRDRIVHSRAFRRLEYKTQVFVNHEGDHYRTRLTHTLEVVMISRTMARTLQLNEDLVEALALVHDVGHPAFGHSGEQILDKLMKDHGGFEHNHQGLRIVEKLEKKYPDFNGLNLSWELREGILKHNTTYDKPANHEYDPHLSPLLEVQLVNLGDEIAYNSHDLDDGLYSGLFTRKDLSNVEIWSEAEERVKRKKPNIEDKILGSYIVREIIDSQVNDVLRQTEKNLQEHNINSIEDVRNTKIPLVCFSPDVARKNRDLKKYLHKNLYTHLQVEIMNQKGLRIINELFDLFISNPRLMDTSLMERTGETSLHRAVCDYLAGMTDRYAFNEYRKLFSLSEKYTF